MEEPRVKKELAEEGKEKALSHKKKCLFLCNGSVALRAFVGIESDSLSSSRPQMATRPALVHPS